MTEIAGRVAVVTGGASGIGRGIAEQLIEEGAQVVIADINKDTVETVAAEIGAWGVSLDVTDAAAVSALADATVEKYGKVEIIVNNAGVGPSAPISALTLDDWHWIINVNLFGVINGVHAFLPHLLGNPNGGHIVNTASMAIFSPLSGLGAYGASKAGVAALSEVLSKELEEQGSAVKVTVLPPGPVRSNIKNSLSHRPTGQTGALVDVDLTAEEGADSLRWINPRDAGRIVTRAIRNNDFLALTHPEWWPMVAERNAVTKASFEKYSS
ncbi:SDR family oxidoreductase [Pseudarthrobacter oxydans]|uniref:SDR family oxidoreductase n=1 Tax=Pseudarthrobacter oxydans TaxID=1671 RepID=UPI00380FA181